MSTPERKLWNILKDRSVADAKFRRQHPIGPYTADFFCAEIALVVELDGRLHNLDHDKARDAYMASIGITVLRIPIWQFEQRVNDAIASIGHKVRVLRERRTTDCKTESD